MTGSTVDAVFDREFAGRYFQVFSVGTDEGLSKPMTFNEAWAELEKVATGAGMGVNCPGIDIREVK